MNAQIINLPACSLDDEFKAHFRKGKGTVGSGALCALHGWHNQGLNGSIVTYKTPSNEKFDGLIEAMYKTPYARNFEYKGVHILLRDDEEIVLDASDLPAIFYRFIEKAIQNNKFFDMAVNDKKLSEPIIQEAIRIYDNENNDK